MVNRREGGEAEATGGGLRLRYAEWWRKTAKMIFAARDAGTDRSNAASR